MRRTSSLIVGGGPAGSAAAIALARRGLRPLLIERDATPRDALCGGFLSWATIARLHTLGIDAVALGAHRIERLSLFAGKRSAEAWLPAQAAGLSRFALDSALIAQARENGAAIERGVAARSFEADHIRLGGGEQIAAEALLLATGKHDLRGIARPKGDTIGLRFRLEPSPSLTRLLAGRIELHLFRGGYAGLLLQEDGGANLCLAARSAVLDEADGKPDRLLAAIAGEAPRLAERLGAARAVGTAQAIANIPYGWRTSNATPGLYRLGDQAGVIPSLAGEGIDIALASGLAAAAAIAAGQTGALYQAAFARQLRRPLAIAGALWRAAEHPATGRMLVAATRTIPGAASIAARLSRVR